LERQEEMDTLLDTVDLLKLNQEDIGNLNISVKSNETEVVIKVSEQRNTRTGQKIPGLTAEFDQTFKELTTTFLKLLHHIEL
jgi:hypothetical protein